MFTVYHKFNKFIPSNTHKRTSVHVTTRVSEVINFFPLLLTLISTIFSLLLLDYQMRHCKRAISSEFGWEAKNVDAEKKGIGDSLAMINFSFSLDIFAPVFPHGYWTTGGSNHWSGYNELRRDKEYDLQSMKFCRRVEVFHWFDLIVSDNDRRFWLNIRTS